MSRPSWMPGAMNLPLYSRTTRLERGDLTKPTGSLRIYLESPGEARAGLRMVLAECDFKTVGCALATLS